MIPYREITIDLVPRLLPPEPLLSASQYDNGRPVKVYVQYDGTDFPLGSGVTAKIQVRKPSGKVVIADAQVSTGTNIVVFNLLTQMTAEYGLIPMELSLTGDGQEPIGTANWITYVEKSPASGSPSDTWVQDIDEKVEQAVEAAEAAESSALDAEAWAVGERDGEPVTDQDETYQNNAKYYALSSIAAKEDAEAAASAAVESARSAADSATDASGSAESASGSATASAGSATQAAGSATAAASSASAAYTSAGAAAQSATESAGYATASENAAGVSAGAAEAAGQSATAAAGSASTAAGHATNAANSATASAGSAAQSANSATASATSAGQAAGSATAAAGSADAADASADRAQEILDSIPEDYSELSEDVANLSSAISEFPSGSYPDMTVGGVMSVDSSAEDQVPYTFRASGGGVAVGNREIDTLVGGTVAWNQVALFPEGTVTRRGVTFVKGSDGAITANGTSEAAQGETSYCSGNAVPGMADHVLYFRGCPSGGSVSTYYIRNGYSSDTRYFDTGNGVLYKYTVSSGFIPQINIASGVTVDNLVFKPQCFDLTQMFGSTIADYIYSLETATPGAGVAWFRRLFPNDYYAHDAGSLKAVEGVSAHVTRGFNQWDEEWESGYISTATGLEIDAPNKIRMKNYMPVMPNTTYYKKTPSPFWNCYYDVNKNYLGYGDPTQGTFTTPSNCRYIRSGFEAAYGATYKHDICINLSDPDMNGTYEPYESHTYALDDSLTLRGIPKLDSANRLYYDGDTYSSDGTVTRRFGIRAYQSGDESLTDAITDGTNTVSKLTTPTIEQADPFTNPQIVDASGTEEYITTGIVPVGHYTKYPTNIVAKVDGLPSDFSTLIATTEKGMTASKAYAVNSLLIVNNQLYRVTASIASGATITPGTNVTAVTIADILTQLLNA